MADVVIEVRGGVVTEVYCDHPDLRAIVIDWDKVGGRQCPEHAGFEWPRLVELAELPEDTLREYQFAI